VLSLYGEQLLAPLPNHKLKTHPFSAVRDFLFSIWKPSCPSATWRGAMLLWQRPTQSRTQKFKR